MIEHRVYGKVDEFSVRELKEVFGELSYLKLVLLFGSRAKKNFTSKSDYDFAIFGEGDFSHGIQAQVWVDLTRKLGIDMNDVDIVDLKKADLVLLDSIKDSYIILKGNSCEVSRLLGENQKDSR